MRRVVPLVLLVSWVFLERFAYYGLRSTMAMRLRDEGLSMASIGMVRTVSSAALLVGFVVGGLLAFFVRRRVVLPAVTMGLVLAQGLGLVSVGPAVVLAAFVGALLRPLVFVALAEELRGEARLWQGAAVGAAVGFVSNLGGFLGGLVGGASASSPGALGAALLVAVVVAAVLSAVVAVAYPGEPFVWPSGEATLAHGGADPYRPAPVVVPGVAPPRLEVLGLVLLSGVAAATASQAGSDAFYGFLFDGGSATSGLFTTVSRFAPMLECGAALVVFGVALALALTGARFSVSRLMGVGACAVGALVMVQVLGAGLKLAPVAVLGSFGGAVAEALFFPCALGLVLTTTSSRGAGVAGAAHAFAVYGAAIVTGLLTGAGRGAFAGPLAVLMAVATVASGIVLVLVGPSFERPGTSARPST